jgi:flagellar secretion chaperone FliS
MTYASQAAQYRETQVMTASPEQLVVILYDHILVSLRRARLAIDNGKVELRVEHLSRAREALGELLSTLDHEKGGAIARDLTALYVFLLSELTDIGRHSSPERLDRVTAIVGELRGAFAVAAGEQIEAA